MEYIIFDLEATCWKGRNDRVSEIIEIGAVKLNEDLEEMDTFSRFVRPFISPELSDFCKSLTSISQKDVGSAPMFNEVISDFEKWIIKSGNEVKLISWGYYDRNQILRESQIKGYHGEIIELLKKNHISLKHEFAGIRKEKACGMEKALERLDLTLEGTHHRGIDDAGNISKIFKKVFSELNL